MKTPKTRDIDIRIALVRRMLGDGVPREAIRHEITLDSSSSDGRADVVVALDHALIGIEIKSGRDTLDRLDEQRVRYASRFDRMVLVLDPRHITDNDRGSVWSADQRLRFGDLLTLDAGEVVRIHGWRDSMPWTVTNRRHIASIPGWQSCKAVASLLWAHEACRVAYAMGSPSFSTRTASLAWIKENACMAKLRPLVAQALRAREPSRWDGAFWSTFDADLLARRAA